MKTSLLTLFLLFVSLASCYAEDEIVSFKLTSANGLPDNNIRKIEQDRFGYLYLQSRNAIYKYDGYRFHELSNEEKHSMPRHHQTTGGNPDVSFSDNLGNPMRLLPNGNLLYFDKKTRQSIKIHIVSPERYKLTSQLKCTVISDKRGLVWISTNGNGLFIYNKKDKSLKHIVKDSPEQLLNTNYIVFMTQDRDGNIWLCGEHHGVIRLQTRQQNYTVVNLNPSVDEKGNDARMLVRLSDGGILVSDMAGKLWKSGDNLKTLEGFYSDGIYISACRDRKGRLWLGSRSKGITVDGKRYGGKRTDCIAIDHKGRMWICGLRSCLKQVSVENGKYHERNFLNEIKDLAPRVILIDHRGDLWLGTKQGLYVLNPDKIMKSPKSYTKVLNEPVMCIYESARQQLWVGSAGHGAYYADNSKASARHFSNISKQDGLANNVVQCIVENKNGILCFGTEEGYSFLNQNTKRMSNLYVSNDIMRNISNERCAITLPEGRIAFGTLDGIIITNPSRIVRQPQQHHRLLVTSLKVNGMPLSEINPYKGDISQQKNITLNYNQNSLEISFSNLDYDDSRQTTYMCKLDGYDKEWGTLARAIPQYTGNSSPALIPCTLRARMSAGR